MIIMLFELPEVESIAGAPGVLPTPFAMHGLASPLAGPYNGVPPAGGLAGLGGFPLGAAGLGVRVQGSAQASAVLLVSNLNEEVSSTSLRGPVPIPFPLTRCSRREAKNEDLAWCTRRESGKFIICSRFAIKESLADLS